MEGPISKSVKDRLPSAIRGLNETYQKIYIYLRLRKLEHEIARQLHLSLEDAKEKINTIRHELIKEGLLYLIENPQIESIHADNPDAQDMPISINELDIDKKLIIKEFLSFLKEAINELPEHQSRLLKLRYNYQMSAKDILEFCNKLEFSLIPQRDISKLKEQDIFYELNTILKNVLKALKMRYKDENSIGLKNLKYILEEIEI